MVGSGFIPLCFTLLFSPASYLLRFRQEIAAISAKNVALGVANSLSQAQESRSPGREEEL